MNDDGGARHAPRSERGGDADATEDAVLRFLAARPDFLARHPSLYLTLAPPARVHGERLADHMAALLAAARRQNAILAEAVRHRRADASFALRVEAALLGALRSGDPVEWMASELAVTLGLDSASICLERACPHTRELAPNGTAPLLAGQAIRFRLEPRDAGLVHGEAGPLVRRDVLVRLNLPEDAGLLALGSRDEAVLPGAGAERALSLLARGIEAALERPLGIDAALETFRGPDVAVERPRGADARFEEP